MSEAVEGKFVPVLVVKPAIRTYTPCLMSWETAQAIKAAGGLNNYHEEVSMRTTNPFVHKEASMDEIEIWEAEVLNLDVELEF